MPVYSIFTHDPEPALEAQVPAVEPAPREQRRVTPAAESSAKLTGRSFDLRDSSLPEVVLQLPDLLTANQAQSWWAWFANQVFWVGIVLGALLALALIWADKKPASQAMDEAPAWTGTSTRQPASTATTESSWTTPSSDHAPPAPEDEAPGAPPVPTNELGATTAPAEAAKTDTQVPAARTARAGDTVWDGNSNQVQPGEAAPVGTIINAVVPE